MNSETTREGGEGREEMDRTLVLSAVGRHGGSLGMIRELRKGLGFGVGRGGGLGGGGWDDWGMPGGGGYKEGRGLDEGKERRGIRSGCASVRRNQWVVPSHGPWFLFQFHQGPWRRLYLGGAIFL